MIILFEPHHWCIFTVWAVNAIEHIVDMASVAAQQTRHLSLLKKKLRCRGSQFLSFILRICSQVPCSEASLHHGDGTSVHALACDQDRRCHHTRHTEIWVTANCQNMFIINTNTSIITITRITMITTIININTSSILCLNMRSWKYTLVLVARLFRPRGLLGRGFSAYRLHNVCCKSESKYDTSSCYSVNNSHTQEQHHQLVWPPPWQSWNLTWENIIARFKLCCKNWSTIWNL